MPSEAVDVDVGQLDGRRLKCPVVVDLDELSPVGRSQSRGLARPGGFRPAGPGDESQPRHDPAGLRLRESRRGGCSNARGPKAYPPKVQVDRRVAGGEAKATCLIHTSSRHLMPVGHKAHRHASQGLRPHEFGVRESGAMRSSVTATSRAVRPRAGEAASRAPKSPRYP